MEILTFSFIGKPKTNPSLDAYRNSFLRVISVIIEIINYPFNLGKMRFKDPPSMSCLTRKKTQATPMIVYQQVHSAYKYSIPSILSTADLTALVSQWKYALHYNCIRISFWFPKTDLGHCPPIGQAHIYYVVNTSSFPFVQNKKSTG
jgi:hypothetical protein